MTNKDIINNLIELIESRAEDAERVSEDVSQKEKDSWNHGYWNGKIIAYRDAVRMLKQYSKGL